MPISLEWIDRGKEFDEWMHLIRIETAILTKVNKLVAILFWLWTNDLLLQPLFELIFKQFIFFFLFFFCFNSIFFSHLVLLSETIIVDLCWILWEILITFIKHCEICLFVRMKMKEKNIVLAEWVVQNQPKFEKI